jgi:small subunit ribosomal protein S2
MKSLLEAGVHFGHQTRRWNPKMRKFIFTERNGIHILDLAQTVDCLEKAYTFVRDLVSEGGTVLFVGTKRQAQETIETESQRCGMPYVTTRWLGGTLTNFQTIQNRIDYLVRLEDAKARGDFENLPKKERLKKEEEITRLNRYLRGIKEMTSLPGAIYIVDTTKEDIAVAESTRMGTPIVSLVDTNCNPDVIDYPIPSNDDAIRAIKLITGRIADAVLDGLTAREHAQKAELEAEDVEVSAYTTSGYVASPDEPDPNAVAAAAEAEALAVAEAEAAAIAATEAADAEAVAAEAVTEAVVAEAVAEEAVVEAGVAEAVAEEAVAEAVAAEAVAEEPVAEAVVAEAVAEEAAAEAVADEAVAEAASDTEPTNEA